MSRKAAETLLSDAEDRLYNAESPFYHYCATGFPVGFDVKAFEITRAELEQDVVRLKEVVKRSKTLYPG